MKALAANEALAAGHDGTNVSALPARGRLRRLLSRSTEAHVLFPAIAVLVLAVIWGTTLNLIRVERVAAERSAAISSHELADTYEAQVVRALREIDQTLKAVKYAYERRRNPAVLEELGEREMLPEDYLFTVRIVDADGNVVATTRTSVPLANLAGREDFQRQRQAEFFSVGLPRKNLDSPEWRLDFARRLDAEDGGFAGIAMVSVEAGYFVSAYEPAKLGDHGLLGIVGTDGIFRSRYTGDGLPAAGDIVDFAALVPEMGNPETETEARLSTNAWDGVRRYTIARQLYDFPLAIVVGLSETEQLSAASRRTRDTLWKASGGSIFLLVIIAALGSMSRRLEIARRLAVEEQITHAARVEYLAYHDGLTTLPNRSLFSKLLNQSISQARRYNRRLAVLFLDLDRFKHINDTLGHEAGDQLLQEVAIRLKSCLRESDTVARLGGDEFVVLLPELEEERYVATVAQKILSAVARPYVLLGHEFRITATIGISIYPEDGLDEQTLTKNADVAMYQAKQGGKNNFQFYSTELNANSLERLTLESGLRHALERNEFQLHYQVKRAIPSCRITGMEALLRWQHPDLGMVAPMTFLPLAEDTGLIVPIGKWVLKAACAQNVAWQQQGLPHLTMAVNLSARQFSDPNLLRDLESILASTGMDPHLLELEVSESLLMRNAEKSRPILVRLKAMGIRIAIDDFGIGYSSLTTLRKFPLDTVKIDRSFICDVTSNVEDKALTDAVMAMGRSLSLTVVAQGVETKEQAEYLAGKSGGEFQGFYLNKPLPAEEIAELLAKQTEAAEVETSPAIET